MKTTFEHLGYFKEYSVNGKFIGTLPSEKDREVFGYLGKIEEVTTEEIIFRNKKKIKKGTLVQTQLFPLCGKVE